MRKKNFLELSIMLFQYTDNPERKLKLRNIQQLRQWTRKFIRELRGGFHGRLHLNENAKQQRCVEKYAQTGAALILVKMIIIYHEACQGKI